MMYVNIPKDAREGHFHWLHGSLCRILNVDPQDESQFKVWVESNQNVVSVKKKYMNLDPPAVVSADLVSSYWKGGFFLNTMEWRRFLANFEFKKLRSCSSQWNMVDEKLRLQKKYFCLELFSATDTQFVPPQK